MSKEQQQQPQQGQGANGVVTVNNERNPGQEERDAAIGQEPDTERLRSERESVEQSGKQ
ncbi:hypothetical protein [Flaviaesturariibacter amylovorans]|uniref:Uncharacterized protein n=1 Tax=Flaviaesturariibacter amylovorans TaxID=1084520 RepID=A0ABP8GH66_9BACT